MAEGVTHRSAPMRAAMKVLAFMSVQPKRIKVLIPGQFKGSMQVPSESVMSQVSWQAGNAWKVISGQVVRGT